ncbi:MAG: IS1 family transposase [Trichlorobacter sp.]
MNRLNTTKRALMLGMLVEGNSMRTVSRMADCSINTVTKLLADVGAACSQYQHENLHNLPCKTIQCDEIWSFCNSKEKNVPQDRKGEFGVVDVYTWTALCADTKLVPSFVVGTRDANYGHAFMLDLASRLSNRVQLTTDGRKVYLSAVENAFGSEIDYAMLVKVYGAAEGIKDGRRYSPAVCTGAVIHQSSGAPDISKASTSFVERQNLNARMSMRRFTRLTNGFSKKIENLEHAVALHFMHYNFARIHKNLKYTPAMEAGVTNRLWSLGDIADLCG